MDGLLGRAALAVDGDTGHGVGQTGGEPAGAGDVAGLATDGVDVAEDDILDRGRVDPGALEQGGDAGGTQVGGVHVGESASALAGGRADGVDDVGLGHGHQCGPSDSGVPKRVPGPSPL